MWVFPKGSLKKTYVLGSAHLTLIEGEIHRTHERGVIFNNKADAIAYAESARQKMLKNIVDKASKYGISLAAVEIQRSTFY